MPRSERPVAIRCIAGVARSCGAKPPVWTTISPCATALMPSVKIIDGTRSHATPMPLTTPSAAPHAMPNGIAIHSPVAPHHPAAAADITPPMVTVQGTERSMPPSRMTSIAPVAPMPRNDAICSCSSRYSAERKLLE